MQSVAILISKNLIFACDNFIFKKILGSLSYDLRGTAISIFTILDKAVVFDCTKYIYYGGKIVSILLQIFLNFIASNSTFELSESFVCLIFNTSFAFKTFSMNVIFPYKIMFKETFRLIATRITT